jgi:hypothetical protein
MIGPNAMKLIGRSCRVALTTCPFCRSHTSSRFSSSAPATNRLSRENATAVARDLRPVRR